MKTPRDKPNLERLGDWLIAEKVADVAIASNRQLSATGLVCLRQNPGVLDMLVDIGNISVGPGPQDPPISDAEWIAQRC